MKAVQDAGCEDYGRLADAWDVQQVRAGDRAQRAGMQPLAHQLPHEHGVGPSRRMAVQHIGCRGAPARTGTGGSTHLHAIEVAVASVGHKLHGASRSSDVH